MSDERTVDGWTLRWESDGLLEAKRPAGSGDVEHDALLDVEGLLTERLDGEKWTAGACPLPVLRAMLEMWDAAVAGPAKTPPEVKRAMGEAEALLAKYRTKKDGEEASDGRKRELAEQESRRG